MQSETQRIKHAGLSLEEQQAQLQELLHKVSAAVRLLHAEDLCVPHACCHTQQSTTERQGCC